MDTFTPSPSPKRAADATANGRAGYEDAPAPFIEIHRPSVAYNHNGPLLPNRLAATGGAANSFSKSSLNSGGDVVPQGGLGPRRSVGGSTMRTNNSFALGAAASNRSFSDNARDQVTYSPRNPSLRAGGLSGARGSRLGADLTTRGGLHLSRTGASSDRFNTSMSPSVSPRFAHLSVNRPAVRINSPNASALRSRGGSGSDDDKDGNSSSGTGSSRSTSDTSSTASSSNFSIGSSLNLEKVRSFFLRRHRGSKGIPLKSSSMFLMDGDNAFRLIVFNIIKSKGFEAFIILLIVANCVLLALNDPGTENEPWQVKTDYFFTAAFATEMVLKFIALGVVLHPGAYFRDPWNILDFVIVMLSFLQLIPQVGNYTALRIFRVLRPLRSLNAVPQLKIIVSGLLHSVKGLANVGILSLITICIFAIIGVQLWQGRFLYRCQDDFTEDIHDDMYCSTGDIGTGFTGRVCPPGFTCVVSANPWDGFVSFDNVWWAFLIVFQCITCEGWSEIQDVAIDACGWYAAVYFIFVVLILNYFILNLALAVINFQFLHAKEKMNEKLREEKEEEELELLAAADEDEEYHRMLLPEEERLMLLDQLEQAGTVGGHTHISNKGPGTSTADGPAEQQDVVLEGFDRATGTLPTLQMRMLKKTTAGRLLYSMEKSAKISNLARRREMERKLVEGENLDDHEMEQLRLFSGGSPTVHNPLRVGSPTVAALAVMSTEANKSTSHLSDKGSNPAGSTNVNPAASSVSAVIDGMKRDVSLPLPAITLDAASPPRADTAGAATATGPLAKEGSSSNNTASAKAPSADTTASNAALGATGGNVIVTSVNTSMMNATNPAGSSHALGAHNHLSRANTEHSSSRAQSRLTNLHDGGLQSTSNSNFGGANEPQRLSINPSSNNRSNNNSSRNVGTPSQHAPSSDDIIRVSHAALTIADLVTTSPQVAALEAAAAAGEEIEDIDFEEASALGSVDETPLHQRGYLRKRWDRCCGQLSWYRCAYKAPPMMGLWRAWLWCRYQLFRLSEGDPYAWHEFDFELLRRAAARSLADDDTSKRKVPEPGSTYFTNFIVFCVVANTCFMAASHYGESAQQTSIANTANTVFSAIFGVEMVIRLTAIGFRSYCLDVSNAFDGAITIISLVEVIFLTGSSSFSVLRAFRLLRIFKLMKAVPSLRKILRVAVVAIQETGYLCVIFLLYLFIAALVGMQLFGTSIKHQDGDPRANFENFYMSFFTVFEILTRDSWPDIMRMTMRDISIVSALYHLVCVFIGDFIILNLFLAILISSFDEVNEEDDNIDVTKFQQINTIKRQPLATMGALVSEQSKRFLRLADHKLQLVETDAILAQDGGYGEDMALLNDNVTVDGDAAQRVTGIHTDEGELCPLCGDIKKQPFPTPSKLIAPMTADELHGRMCARIALRKAKARVIRDLLEEIGGVGALNTEELNMTAAHNGMGLTVQQQLQSYKFGEFDVGLGYNGGGAGGRTASGINLKGVKPSPETVDELFGRAWEAGLLLNRNADDYFSITSWDPISALLKEEQLVLNLHVGEEMIGQSLVAYTRANVPREFFTNGGKSLWIFGPRNKLRVVLTQIIANPWFDRVVLFLIAFSSITMAFDNPRTPEIVWMTILGRVFTCLFALESLVKVIALGFVFHNTAYLRDPWNILDFFIVLISIIAWILEGIVGGQGLGALKVLRTLRTLRPLRFINRNRGLKMVISTLILSMKGIANVALINGLIYLIFSILGVQLFAGALYSCNDETINNRHDCVGSYTVEQYMPFTRMETKIINGVSVTKEITYTDLANVTEDRAWINADYNFDNTYNAFLNLFHIVTLDDWGTTMWAVIDSVGPNKGPIKNNRPYWGLYFLVFITVGCFFLLNMFVGVIISSFGTVKDRMDGSSMLTKDQKLWVETQRLMLNFRPERKQWPVFPSNPICTFLFKVAQSGKFEALTGAVVALNVVFIGMDHYGQSPQFSNMLRIANYVFLGCFIGEFLVKFLAIGFNYFKSAWNCFDFFLVLIGIVDLLADGILPFNLGILRVFRVFRIMRMLVLVRRARSVRVLLETLWYSLPSLVNIGTFMLLIFFMYAVLGVQLFAKVKRTHGMTDNVNFENFGNSFLFLIQLVTLDNWGTIMLGTMNTRDCGEDSLNECGTAWAPLYYFSFIVFASWVIMNVFVAIILDNFDNTMHLDKSKLKMSHLKKFTDCWSEFDPEATLIMETRYFPNLLLSLHSPLGIDRVGDRKKIMQLADNYRIVEHGGVIHFVETMVPMARRVLGVEFSEAELRAHEDHWRAQFPSLAKLKILRYRMKRVTVDQFFGATYLSAAFRRRAAYRYVNMLRDEKLAELERWYDDNNVPIEGREASYRMLERAEARRQTTNQFHMRKAVDDDLASQATSRASSRMGFGTGAYGGLPDGPERFDGNEASMRSGDAGMGGLPRKTSLSRFGNTTSRLGGRKESDVGELMGLGRRKY